MRLLRTTDDGLWVAHPSRGRYFIDYEAPYVWFDDWHDIGQLIVGADI